MNQFRSATILLLACIVFLFGSADLRSQDKVVDSADAEQKEDISGEWLSDSPLEIFVEDDSTQPVNNFRIDRLKVTGFEAKYLGSRADGVALRWIENKHQFEGTKKSRQGMVEFVVTPTADPDVLNCTIKSDTLNHKDQWKRVPRDPKAPKTTERGPGETAILRYDEDSGVTLKMKEDTEELLSPYAQYLKRQGFELQKGQVVLRLQPGMSSAHYYQTNRSIVMDPLVVSDKSVMRREYNHHALSVSLGADSQEIFQKCSGIESALADYFGCSSCDDPVVGAEFVKALGMAREDAPYLRTMDSQRNFSEIQDSSERHDVGEVLSGALWEMRESLGRRVLDRMLCKAWVAIVKSDASKGQVVRFAASLLEIAREENPEYAKEIADVFARRRLALP